MEFLKERCPVLKKLSESKIDLIFREARIEYFREGERVFLQGFPCEYFGLVFSGMVLKRMEVSLEKGNRIPTAAGSVTDRLHLCLTSVFQIEFKYLTGEFFAFFDIIKGYTEFSEDLVVGAPSLLLLVKADCFKLFDKKEKECFLEASRKKIPDSHEALHEQFSRELQFS
jgi:signal-transduction protein with cAMP-binding, CBS, and nucleotidyltransferase domain